MTASLIVLEVAVSALIIDRVHFHAKRLRFKKLKAQEETERRFDFLLVHLYACENWMHLEAFRNTMDRMLTVQDRNDIRFNEFIIEVEKMDAALTNDLIKLQNIRTKEGDNILSQVKF